MREATLQNRLVSKVRAGAPTFGVLIGVGSFLAVLAPFGTQSIGWPAIWVYWVGLTLIGAGGGLIAGRAAERFAGYWPRLAQLAFSAFCASIPVTVAVIALQSVASGDLLQPTQWPTVFAYVVVVSAAITTVMALVAEVRARPAPTTPADARAARFMERLPARLRAAHLFAVQSEDHYVRAHTSAGDDLILMRLSDALVELEALDGMQVHRSWWVAREAVADVTRGSGRMTLVLKNGVETPISRTYVRRLRAAGWA